MMVVLSLSHTAPTRFLALLSTIIKQNRLNIPPEILKRILNITKSSKYFNKRSKYFLVLFYRYTDFESFRPNFSKVSLTSRSWGGRCFDGGADLGGGCRWCAPLPEMTYGFLIQLVLCKKMWFIGVSCAIP